MKGIDCARHRAHSARDARSRLDGDVVRARITRAFVVVTDAGFALRRDVLHEAPTERDVEDLDTATNREHGSPAALCRLDERRLGCIAGGVYRTYFRVRGLTISGGIDIFSAGEYQPRYRCQNPVGGAIV